MKGNSSVVCKELLVQALSLKSPIHGGRSYTEAVLATGLGVFLRHGRLCGNMNVVL